jgi:hypothetical protein
MRYIGDICRFHIYEYAGTRYIRNERCWLITNIDNVHNIFRCNITYTCAGGSNACDFYGY